MYHGITLAIHILLRVHLMPDLLAQSLEFGNAAAWPRADTLTHDRGQRLEQFELLLGAQLPRSAEHIPIGWRRHRDLHAPWLADNVVAAFPFPENNASP